MNCLHNVHSPTFRPQTSGSRSEVWQFKLPGRNQRTLFAKVYLEAPNTGGLVYERGVYEHIDHVLSTSNGPMGRYFVRPLCVYKSISFEELWDIVRRLSPSLRREQLVRNMYMTQCVDTGRPVRRPAMDTPSYAIPCRAPIDPTAKHMRYGITVTLAPMDAHVTLWDFMHLPYVSPQDQLRVLCTLVCCVDYMHRTLHVSHNDLHANNILVVEHEADDVHLVRGPNGALCTFGPCRFSPVLFDWDHAQRQGGRPNPHVAHWPLFEPHLFSPQRDWWAVLVNMWATARPVAAELLDVLYMAGSRGGARAHRHLQSGRFDRGVLREGMDPRLVTAIAPDAAMRILGTLQKYLVPQCASYIVLGDLTLRCLHERPVVARVYRSGRSTLPLVATASDAVLAEALQPLLPEGGGAGAKDPLVHVATHRVLTALRQPLWDEPEEMRCALALESLARWCPGPVVVHTDFFQPPEPKSARFVEFWSACTMYLFLPQTGHITRVRLGADGQPQQQFADDTMAVRPPCDSLTLCNDCRYWCYSRALDLEQRSWGDRIRSLTCRDGRVLQPLLRQLQAAFDS